jgi:hypothetical protein
MDNIRADILVDILEHTLAFVLRCIGVAVLHIDIGQRLVEVAEPQLGFVD